MAKILLAVLWGTCLVLMLGADGCGGGSGSSDGLVEDAGTDTDTDADTDSRGGEGMWDCLICNGAPAK